MFKRTTDGNISFDLVHIEPDGTEKHLKNFTKTLQISSKGYSSRDDLVNNEGESLQYWAEDMIKYEALKIAGRDVGMSEEEATADLDATILYAGGSFKAINIDGQAYNFKEEGIPKYILDQIEYMEEMFRTSDNDDERAAIRNEINKLKEKYGIV